MTAVFDDARCSTRAPDAGIGWGPTAVSVAVVEDHPLYREAVAQVVKQAGDLTLTLTAGSIEEFEARSRHERLPDVVVLDLNLPGLDGPAGVAQVASHGLTVLVLSASWDHQAVVDAIKAGARGYLTKQAQVEEILTAVRAVASGKQYIAPTLIGRLAQSVRQETSGDRSLLSEREQQIVQLVARGETDQEIASQLCISVSTVRSHLDRIRDKTGHRRRADLTRYAMELELIG
ncbi:MAG: response regulator [Angustibacter sp.]